MFQVTLTKAAKKRIF